MQDATTDAEGLEPDMAEGELTVTERLARIENELGVVGTAIDMSSQLHIEQTKVLERVVTAVESLQPPTP
jgi:hypothetical protein